MRISGVLFVLALATFARADTVLVPGGTSVTLQCDAPPLCPAPVACPAPVVCAAPPATPLPAPAPTAGVLFRDDFETGLGAWDQTAQQARVVEGFARTGANALRVDQPQYGWGGELAKSFSQRTQVYIKLGWFIPLGFNHQDRTGRHFWRILGSPIGTSGNRYQTDNETDNGSATAARLQTVQFWGKERSDWGAAELPMGRWFELGYWLKLNDVGQANGEIAITIDGVQKFSRTGLELRTSEAAKIEGLRLVTNFDACEGVCHWFYDDIEVKEARP